MKALATGYLSRNWGALNSEAPAIVINPSASPLDLLAWCWGEVESLHQVAKVCDETGMDGEALGAVFLHRLAPLSAVFCDAIQAMVREKMQRQAAQQQGGAA